MSVYSTQTIVNFVNCTAEGNVPGFCERWIVPMTTAWEAPDGCPTVVPHGRVDEWYLTCGPPGYEAVFVNDGYYSPGVCPSAYTVGCTAAEASMNGEEILASETVAMCVPSGYECDDLEGDGLSVWWGTRTSTNMAASQTNSVESRPAFQIRWRSQDLDHLPYHPMTPVAVVTSASEMSFRSSTTLPAATSSGSELPETAGAGSGGLGPGVIAGIAVGAVAGIALLGGLLWFLLRRKKQQTQAIHQYDPTAVQYVDSPPPGDMYFPPQQQHPSYQHPQYPQQGQQHQYYPQQYQPYAPTGAPAYYDKSGAVVTQQHAAYAQYNPGPPLQSTPPVPAAYQQPPKQFAQPAPARTRPRQ